MVLTPEKAAVVRAGVVGGVSSTWVVNRPCMISEEGDTFLQLHDLKAFKGVEIRQQNQEMVAYLESCST